MLAEYVDYICNPVQFHALSLRITLMTLGFIFDVDDAISPAIKCENSNPCWEGKFYQQLYK